MKAETYLNALLNAKKDISEYDLLIAEKEFIYGNDERLKNRADYLGWRIDRANKRRQSDKFEAALRRKLAEQEQRIKELEEREAPRIYVCPSCTGQFEMRITVYQKMVECPHCGFVFEACHYQ